MCLAIPMQIIEIRQFMARCAARGVERDVSLMMIADETLHPGDFIAVHSGYAIHTMSADEAESAWQIYDEMLLLEDAQNTR